MRKLFTILAAVLMTATVWAQSPEKMSYQAVIRNASNNLVASHAVGMKITILQNTTPVYVEIYNPNPSTNANGLVTIEIGSGIPLTGTFAAIDWSAGPYFIKTETDPTGGTTYSITGTSQLLSVPYALHAKTAESITGTVTEADPIFVAWDKDYSDLTNTPTTITTAQASAITANTSKVGITTGQASAITANTAKVGITTAQSNAITANTAKVGYTDALVSANTDVAANTAKVGITTAQASAITANTAKVGITTAQASAIAANTAKVGVTNGTAAGQMQYWNGTAWVTVATGYNGATLTFVNGVPTWVYELQAGEVENPTTGKIWMAKNLGASQVATSSTDAASYGDLYQWGRAADGHQIRTSGTTTTLSTTDNPGHGNFIINGSSPYDWRSSQNDNLWQGVSGTNNPCPSGYRLPTAAEWTAEKATWSAQTSAGAFASPLKLPVAGYRDASNGSLDAVGFSALYWSSTVAGAYSRYLVFYSSAANMVSSYRAYGSSMRCLKD